MPWALPVVALAKNTQRLAACLVRDGLVERKQLRRWSKHDIRSDSAVVRGFGDPFAVNFSRSAVKLWVTRGEVLHLAAVSPAADNREGIMRYPYTGECS